MSGSSERGADALREELALTRERLAAVEAERDELSQQVDELFVLQQVFSTMNSTLEIDDILSTVLRGVHQALTFRRVILFDVLGDGTIVRRLDSDGEGNVSSAADERGYREGSVLHDVAARALAVATGSAGEANAPLADTRGAYCLVPLVARGVVRGLLYGDDPRTERIGDNTARMLLDFASQAAMAMENAGLYEETRRLLEETQRLALTDALTGIANRRALSELFDHELKTAERYETPLAFLILDLDDLKRVNDSGGHSLGDLALKRFSQVLASNARRGDIVARYAGDEFVVVMTHGDRTAAMKGSERLLEALRRSNLRASIGVAMYPDDGRDAQSLFFAADEALYEAKHAGKDCCRFYRAAANNAQE